MVTSGGKGTYEITVALSLTILTNELWMCTFELVVKGRRSIEAWTAAVGGMGWGFWGHISTRLYIYVGCETSSFCGNTLGDGAMAGARRAPRYVRAIFAKRCSDAEIGDLINSILVAR